MIRIETTARWMVVGDLPAVLAIEEASFAEPLNEEEFRWLASRRRHVALVATLGPSTSAWAEAEAVGYVIFEMGLADLTIRRLAVAPDRRGLGVGEALAQAVMAKLGPRRRVVRMAVPDSNLGAQLWLKALNWRAVKVVGDRYLFQWPSTGAGAPAWEG